MVIFAPLNSKIRPIKFVGFDVETDVNHKKQPFKMGSVVGKDFIKVFWNKEKMKSFLLSKPLRNHVRYATNLTFDLGALYHPFGEKWFLLLNGTRLIYGSFQDRKAGNYCRFHDTTNLNYFMSVKEMGDIIGVPKKDIDFYTCSDSELEQYNIQDSTITFRFMSWFNKYINELGGNTKSTISSVAMDLFRKKYLKSSYKNPCASYNQLSRMSYYGGRCEVFKKGDIDNNFYVYDFNSLYPSVMKTISLPDTNHLSFQKYPEYSGVNVIENYEGVSKVRVKINDMYVPILPLKAKNTKLIFPVGEWEGVYTHNEIRYAIMHGYKILNVEWSLYSEKTCNIFHDYITDLYRKRKTFQDKKDKREIILKVIMNSTYGKLGINIRKKNSGIITHVDNIKSVEDFNNYYQYGNSDYWFLEPKYNPCYEIPIWAAYITAGARIRLHQALINCSELYYCDTDSIFTSDVIIPSDKLGELNLQHTCLSGNFKSPKAYKLCLENGETEIKYKGIPQKYVQEYWENGFTVSFENFTKLRTGLIGKRDINEIYDVEKNERNISQKRMFDKEGKSAPIIIYTTEA